MLILTTNKFINHIIHTKNFIYMLTSINIKIFIYMLTSININITMLIVTLNKLIKSSTVSFRASNAVI